MNHLSVVVIKPSKYGLDGYVERFVRGFMPNATIPFLAGMVPESVEGVKTTVHTVDEYIHTNTAYLDLLDARQHGPTLLLLVGVQSHQFQRALDLGAYARERGCMTVIGGPHPMTCDTTMLQGRGVSFSLAESELVLPTILHDAVKLGELQLTYGQDQRWSRTLEPPLLKIPTPDEMRRHVIPMLGIYPARGCPFLCNFCSVIKIAGRNIRSQPVSTTLETLRRAKQAGVRRVMFTTDNFNKYAEATPLLEAIIEEQLDLEFFIQCDTQVVRQPEFVELFARAGGYMIFLGVESLNRQTLRHAKKNQNRPERYQEIRELCERYGISSHFSMIIGFPEDTYDSVLEQLEALKKISPPIASFYTLCPIPGTEQYREFKAAGLLVEPNLDRYDAICPTWKHPNLSHDELRELFKICYRKFYDVGHVVRNFHWPWQPGNQLSNMRLLSYSVFAQLSARRGTHPMSGGIRKAQVDHVDAYLPLRRQTYGFDLVPLPDNLELSPVDAEFNSRVQLKMA